ncbi:carboxypeptidase-like regulatory domain-containing protein [Winogradskyella alexanderae]|uniref:Carboxypeptidase-like regulatory domain-containing protein n=1 Tax=Winogradskyella alexanderae TaxID=2877123 RepID=A0ABS7XUY2_9FLAO|nr:carboxypeptidase-like regulatory domain-containing protein [Winogradskyella alexanderae]MCA0132831.1 carboxypeptidase-like regulatory domain-containing protein [Winogradskyella alexanderae]
MISNLRLSLFFAFTSAFIFVANAQIELKNKVVDFSTLLPLENASIYIKNTTIGTVSNSDGRFLLLVPEGFSQDTIVISSIGFKTFKTKVDEFDNSLDIFLEEDIATLDEVVILAEPRPTDGNGIVLKAIEKLDVNLPDSSYVQKGFFRHKERNKVEFKWLIESAITLYDSGYTVSAKDYLKLNVDEVRKSYDLRDIDSIFSYVAYTNQKDSGKRIKITDVERSELSKEQLVKAIKWNDTRVNGLKNLFSGKLNLLRNSKDNNALFGEEILSNHQFELDTILVDNERKIYKIKIDKSFDFVGLQTEGIYNEGYIANGWLYIYYDNYAIKRIEYNLIAASDAQKIRSKRLFDTQTNHKLILNYMEFQDKMYPNYIYYETPKLVTVGLKSDTKMTESQKERYNKNERYYSTIQEVLFSEIVLDNDIIKLELEKDWDADIFATKPYNKEFWRNYNVLLESEEDEKLIKDLTKKAQLFKE